ncbi:MAG: carbonic anhydrase [Anaerohalosphaera sp.]|nr:carbonic anhydrase [Anaerohalosphaera sp.]
MEQLTGQQALDELLAGNRRFVQDGAVHPHQNHQRRSELKDHQDPHEIVLTCSDSRVSPEIIFDVGIGDIFVVRTAGNILDDIVIGSMEYAALHLGSPLLLVMGHTCCGAVTATVEGGTSPGHIPFITDALAPAMKMASQQQGDLIENTILQNALMTAQTLRESEPVLKELCDSGKLLVKACLYDIETGIVSIL